jgi:putative hemolysin
MRPGALCFRPALVNSLTLRPFARTVEFVSPIETLICVGLLAVAAFTSAAEVALFSLSRFQLRSLKEKLRTQHRKIKTLLSDPGGLLISVLLVNETVNIALSAIIAEAVAQTELPLPEFLASIPPWAIHTILGILITTPLVLFIGELTPKVVATKANQLIATLAATPMTILYDATKPVRNFLRRYLDFLGRITGSSHTAHHSTREGLTESEFLMMVEEGHREGAIQENELELIRNVFDLDDTLITEVMTPLHQVQSMAASTTLKGALTALRSQRYSRIPVTSADRRQVVGVVYSKDLLRAKLEPELLNLAVSSIMRKPLLVPPNLRLNALFRRFKQQKTHLAVVQGQSGDAIGIVTMSDVLDALFEDLLEEEAEPGGHE